jgi:antitoxin (DNA-binding transcriptional repressor) of toxin-antitoxin stability system
MMSDMATFQVKNRDFQRSPADWLHKARQGDTVVIVSPNGPAVMLTAGRPSRASEPDWIAHFEWLKKQPVSNANPVDELRKTDKR